MSSIIVIVDFLDSLAARVLCDSSPSRAECHRFSKDSGFFVRKDISWIAVIAGKPSREANGLMFARQLGGKGHL